MTIQKTTIRLPEFTLPRELTFTLSPEVPNFSKKVNDLLKKVPPTTFRGLVFTAVLGSSILAGVAVPQLVDSLIRNFLI